MPSSSSAAAAQAVVVCVALASCGEGSNSPPDAGYDCSIEDRDDVFVVGLEKAGERGALRFRLMSSMPAPPSRGDNAWSIEVLDAGGAPVAGATLEVDPFMPDHRHGTAIEARLTEQGGGRYQAERINLWMPGLWEVTIKARPATGQDDRAVFRFCVAP